MDRRLEYYQGLYSKKNNVVTTALDTHIEILPNMEELDTESALEELSKTSTASPAA